MLDTDGGYQRRPWTILLVVAVHASVFARAWQWYPLLPERLPVHFDLSGQPDRWAQKSEFAWLILPGIGLLLMLLLLLLAAVVQRLAERRPQLCNVPHKPLFVALPAAARSEAMRPARDFLHWLALLLGLLFGWIVEGTARVAVGEWEVLPTWPMLAFLVALLLLVLPLWRGSANRIRELAAREGLL